MVQDSVTKLPTSGCTVCGAETISGIGATECTAVADGCAAGQYKDGSSCVDCAVGKYSAAGADSCTPCGTGYTTAGAKTSGTSAAACTVCAATYVGTPVDGASGCEQCVAGKYSLNNECVDCAAGTYPTAVGQTACTACPA